MDWYADLHVASAGALPPHRAIGELFGDLHRALYDLSADDVGISLPEHRSGPDRTPGGCLRLHSSKERLTALLRGGLLAKHLGVVECGGVQPVPAGAKHRVVRRRQFNTGGPSRARRYARRHGVSLVEASRIYSRLAARALETPFLKVASRSTGQAFSLFIEHDDLQDAPVPGAFSLYGLSRGATVPWF
ncbi:type I-F CRISPR-associated endoribonuclease Cas6/Csy4 [uncultured Halomonas sp.]|uniref:type I-F CRISPR-associated endoribonuclease Cas6/Csy4 n=1 Tax=uncultured Halomonas sp. TaxID=173971 RepID=UPI00263004A0|nr:type I-F CRISPR-associated endoribonuclease Cas6/Csy4 [uncultured Halomonas sp.]